MQSDNLEHELERISQGRHHDPFSVLGKHREQDIDLIRVFLPQADNVTIAEGDIRLERIPDTDIFEWRGTPGTVPDRYHLVWSDADQHEHTAHDPYSFPPQLSATSAAPFSDRRSSRGMRCSLCAVHSATRSPL